MLVTSFPAVKSGHSSRCSARRMLLFSSGVRLRSVLPMSRMRFRQTVSRLMVVSAPVAVRYAWADNPEEANLYNSAGLPASSFRTDTWEV